MNSNLDDISFKQYIKLRSIITNTYDSLLDTKFVNTCSKTYKNLISNLKFFNSNFDDPLEITMKLTDTNI